MADSRQQIYNFIDQAITDPLNRQNTAEVVRAVLKYIVQHSANLADDGGLFNTPEGVTWTVKPTLQVSGNTLTVSEAEADWSGVTVLYNAATFTLATPATGLERLDTVYANLNGTYGVDAGPEGESAVAEQPPVGTLLAGFVLVGAAGGEVQPQAVPVDYAPLALTDAVTVAYNSYQNGKVRPNAELPLAVTPLLQTLSIANTQLGYSYQIRIKNCSGQQVTVSPVSGVSYKGITGEVLTAVTLPDSGDCLLTYYHASSGERVLEVLEGSPPEPTPYDDTALQDRVTTVEQALGTKADNDHTHTGYQPTLVSGTNLKTVGGTSLLGSGDIPIAAFTPITLNQYGTHPAFTSQHELNVWLLENAYTK